MTLRTLIHRSLRFHARAHLGVVLGAAIGSAALIGALAVGDSVRERLRQKAIEGLGQVEFALSSFDRFFTEKLAQRMLLPAASGDDTRAPKLASLLVLPALAVRED